MLKYIFAGLFVALAWAAVFVFPELLPMWVAVVVTAVIVVGLGAFVLFKALKAKKAAAAIEGAIANQAQAHAGSARPDLRAEIAAMQAEFSRAVGQLKSSKLGGGGRDALGKLPWYVMIGPPGSGKTTAIRNSGLKFPSAGKGRVRGVGGTRNCDWWLANEAILLDTAGRWSTDDDDRDEWLAFLDLLRRTRPGKPINGLMVAVSVADLLENEDHIQSLAHNLRERVDEVMGRLEMVLPVYLVVTKCDLLPGFVEMFEDLRDKERGQIWGLSLPILADGAERQDLFVEHLDELFDTLAARAVQRLGEERSFEGRWKIYGFPQQVESMRQNLIDLSTMLFAQNNYQDSPIMRGLYFTSGTQEGAPIDKMMARMAEAFGMHAPVARLAAPAKPKSYFVRDLFLDVVVPDRDVAVRSKRLAGSQRLVRYGLTAAAMVVSLLLLLLPIRSYFENRAFIDQLLALVDELGNGRAPNGVTKPAALEQVEPTITRLAKFESAGADWSLRFGLFPGEKLMIPLETAIRQLVLRPILEVDLQQMSAFLRREGLKDAESIHDALTLHLLLTQPKEDGEPTPADERAWKKRWTPMLARLAAERWASNLGEGVTARGRVAVEGAANVVALRHELDLWPERRRDLVVRVRDALAGGPKDPLKDLERDPEIPRGLTIVDVLGGAVPLFRFTSEDAKDSVVVPGAYTAPGWAVASEVFDRLSEPEDDGDDAWILGGARKRKAVDVPALRAAYFQRYVEVWKNFFLALSLTEPKSLDEVRTMLKALVIQKPFGGIWRNAAKNLGIKEIASPQDKIIAAQKKKLKGALGQKTAGSGLDATDIDAAEKRAAGSGAPPASAERVGAEVASFLRFGDAGGGLDQYIAMLGEVQTALGEPGMPLDPKAVGTTLRGVRSKLDVLLSAYNIGGWEAALLERLLAPPLRAADALIEEDHGKSVSGRWCETVVVAFEQQIAGKFPFANGAGVRDVRIADLEKFFKPKDGTLWAHYAEALQPDIDHPANSTVFRLRPGTKVKYAPSLFAFLKRAQELTDFLFARDATKIGVPYAVRIRPSGAFSKIMFESGGRRIVYINTKEKWEDMLWPGKGALFTFVDRTSTDGQVGYADGEWALFHLLGRGKLEPVTDAEDYLAGTWTPPVGDANIRADFRPATLSRAFRGFDVPKAIVSGSPGCEAAE